MSLRFKKTLKRRFTALHAAVDTSTLMVQAVRVRTRSGGDAKELVPLLKRVASKNLRTVYGDKAYISRKNVQHIHDLGAYPGIEPKKRLKARSRGLVAAVGKLNNLIHSLDVYLRDCGGPYRGASRRTSERSEHTNIDLTESTQYRFLGALHSGVEV